MRDPKAGHASGLIDCGNISGSKTEDSVFAVETSSAPQLQLVVSNSPGKRRGRVAADPGTKNRGDGAICVEAQPFVKQ